MLPAPFISFLLMDGAGNIKEKGINSR